MDIVTRIEWRARPPVKRFEIPLPSQRLWLHHTATNGWHGPAGVRSCQDFHMDVRGYSDIAYSFLVDEDGAVYCGRGAGVAGGHTEGDNTKSHAICAMGDLSSRHPSDRMLASIVELAVHGYEQGWWPNQITGGHRNAPGAQTACPGDHLYARIPDLNRLITARLTPSSNSRGVLLWT